MKLWHTQQERLRWGSTKEDKTGEHSSNDTDHPAQLVTRLRDISDYSRETHQETRQRMNNLMEMMRRYIQQEQQQKLSTPSRSVAFRKIGGLYFTVFAGSNLAIWEQRHLKHAPQQEQKQCNLSDILDATK